MTVVILAAVALLVGTIVLGQFLEQQVEGLLVKKTLLNKEVPELPLPAALVQQHGPDLQGGQQPQMFGALAEFNAAVAEIEDLAHLDIVQPAPAPGNVPQHRALLPLPDQRRDDRTEGNHAEVVKKQAELQRPGGERPAIVLAVRVVMSPALLRSAACSTADAVWRVEAITLFEVRLHSFVRLVKILKQALLLFTDAVGGDCKAVRVGRLGFFAVGSTDPGGLQVAQEVPA